jgi:hypothetical protein
MYFTLRRKNAKIFARGVATQLSRITSTWLIACRRLSWIFYSISALTLFPTLKTEEIIAF